MNLEQILEQHQGNHEQTAIAVDKFLAEAHAVDRTELAQAERAQLTLEINVATRLKLMYSDGFQDLMRSKLPSQMDRLNMSAEEQIETANRIGHDLLDKYGWE